MKSAGNNTHRVRTRIIGTGSGIPDRVLTNFDLEKIVDTNDEWIAQRTGIRERRLASAGESTVTFGLKAAESALEAAGLTPDDLDMIIVATQTPDMPVPSAACLLQGRLGARKARAFDVVAGCTGWVYGLVVADAFIKTNPYFNIMVVGAEVLSSRVNWEDRSTCVLFGDGAGAVIVTGADNGQGLLASCIGADGSEWESLTIVGGGSMHPPTHETVDKKLQFIQMEGNKVFKLAVPAMEEMCWQVLSDTGHRPEDVDVFIPHQANLRIMEAVIDRLGIPVEKVVVTLDKYGNTSTASIPVALDEALRSGRIKDGDLVLTAAFGGGFTWGAALLQW